MKNQFVFCATFAAISVLALTSCSSGGGGGGESTSSSVVFETPHCNDYRSFSDSVVVSGVANFQYRPVATTSSKQGIIKGLSGTPVSDSISFAEIIVYNSANEVIQCGITNADGSFQVSLAKNTGDVRLQVLSRGFNSRLKVSVLENTTTNSPYALEKTFGVGVDNINAGEFLAHARLSQSSKLEGGAFHILKSIYKANNYIRTEIANDNWVAEKVTIYWKAGFNPYSYFGYPENPLSFYKPGDRKLYILGGYNGNVDTADTDHFDASVILHEYGHFLEDVYGKTDSPGGYHNGDAVIDPRLAWSEGFANFFQSAVLGKFYYLDTAGFCNDPVETSGSCSQNVYIALNEDATTSSFDRMTGGTPEGEGNFREISVSRTLYKMISPASTANPLGAGIPFKEIWTVFSDSTTGYHASAQAFRSSILMNKNINLIVASSYSGQTSYWNNILSNEKQSKIDKHFANTFNEQVLNTCTQVLLSPVIDKTVCSGSYCPYYKRSNQYRSNDFYKITVTQADIDSNATIALNYGQKTASQPVDLDLYLYKQDYTYFEEYQEKESGEQSQSIVKRSVRTYGALENGYEAITLNQLSPGTYMLVVKANTYGKTSSGVGDEGQYRVQKIVNSTQRDLCPIN
jgi:hypothetical protein